MQNSTRWGMERAGKQQRATSIERGRKFPITQKWKAFHSQWITLSQRWWRWRTQPRATTMQLCGKNVVNCTRQRRLSAYEHCGGASEPSGRLWGLLGQPLPTGQSMGWRLRSKQLRTSWIILQAEGSREGRP